MRRSQEDRSNSTKAALTAAARELFATRGYQDVPADEIVRAAGVTRGALHHHYGDKKGLFRAVVEELELELMREIEEKGFLVASDPLSAMMNGLDVFLTACLRQDVRQISLTDGPAVLGWNVWRALEENYALGMMERMLAQAMRDGLIVAQPVRALAQLVLSAIMEAARMIAASEHPEPTRAEVQQVLGLWFAGLLKRE
ncbi:TetR/AcrR family transcriptional regulator [Amycolatopsis sp. GM8]|uniref:TetR/AcrR family transcriptional regulator n=1 Tax=Amycolatopsis sp. GM8 TaxID=2896530 RepID=UPI001F408B46|nr:TetR/AcrR family transcriptional regulator [Amycolatopsis sp. GM8]